MSNKSIYDNSKIVSLLMEKEKRESAPDTSGLKGGGGGGTLDGMETRVAALEVHMEYLKKDVADVKAAVLKNSESLETVKTQAAVLTERVSHLPTVAQSVAMLGLLLTLIAGLVTFQGNIQRFVGVPSAVPAAATPSRS